MRQGQVWQVCLSFHFTKANLLLEKEKLIQKKLCALSSVSVLYRRSSMYIENLMSGVVFGELEDSNACNEGRAYDAPNVLCKFIDLDFSLLYIFQ